MILMYTSPLALSSPSREAQVPLASAIRAALSEEAANLEAMSARASTRAKLPSSSTCQKEGTNRTAWEGEPLQCGKMIQAEGSACLQIPMVQSRMGHPNDPEDDKSHLAGPTADGRSRPRHPPSS